MAATFCCSPAQPLPVTFAAGAYTDLVVLATSDTCSLRAQRSALGSDGGICDPTVGRIAEATAVPRTQPQHHDERHNVGNGAEHDSEGVAMSNPPMTVAAPTPRRGGHVPHHLLDDSERLSREQLGELQLDRLRRTLRYAYENVELYRKKFDEAGKRPDDCRSLDDLSRFPFTANWL